MGLDDLPRERFTHSLTPAGDERLQILRWHAEEVGDPHMRKLAAVAHPVHGVPAHTEPPRDLRHGQEATHPAPPTPPSAALRSTTS